MNVATSMWNSITCRPSQLHEEFDEIGKPVYIGFNKIYAKPLLQKSVNSSIHVGLRPFIIFVSKNVIFILNIVGVLNCRDHYYESRP